MKSPYLSMALQEGASTAWKASEIQSTNSTSKAILSTEIFSSPASFKIIAFITSQVELPLARPNQPMIAAYPHFGLVAGANLHFDLRVRANLHFDFMVGAILNLTYFPHYLFSTS
jgi:hypothetical protein